MKRAGPRNSLSAFRLQSAGTAEWRPSAIRRYHVEFFSVGNDFCAAHSPALRANTHPAIGKFVSVFGVRLVGPTIAELGEVRLLRHISFDLRLACLSQSIRVGYPRHRDHASNKKNTGIQRGV